MAIRLAVANEIIVIEAGGNGNHDLDDWKDQNGRHILSRASADFQDSGAILVGAGTAALPHNRSFWPSAKKASCYGSRIDCYAWGDSIVTTGYGVGKKPRGVGSGNSSYVFEFAGTSGASPIIAGSALLLQGLYYATHKKLLSPQQMRALISNPKTGTPQGTEVAGNIGVMPNLRAIVQDLLGQQVERQQATA
jgi:serine protease